MTGEQRPVSVTRDALYQQVWQKPMNRLALDYGISGNGLAKICDRLKIPYPPRGYWAKKAAGQKVAQYRLPDAASDTPDTVTIAPTPPLPLQRKGHPFQDVIVHLRNSPDQFSAVR